MGLAASADDITVYRAGGCRHCAGTGFTGRAALYEVMAVLHEIRRVTGDRLS